MSESTEEPLIDEQPEPGWWRRLLGPGRFSVFLLVLLLAAAAVYLGVRAVTLSGQATTQDNERAQALSEASRDAADLTTYDYRNLAAAFASVAADSTPAYGTRYRSASEGSAGQLRAQHSTSNGTVVAAGIETETPSRSATVLVLVNQSITNTTTPTPKIQRSALRITLARSGQPLADQRSRAAVVDLSLSERGSADRRGMAMRWTAQDVPDQSGRTVVVTGGAAGIGLETARVLAERGARVVLACRDPRRVPRIAGDVTAVRLDLASLASVRAAAEEIRTAVPRLDLLVNNAGVMDVPFQRTEDGIELTFATNHVGHFALTGLLLDTMVEGGRIVTVSSVAHRRGTADFTEPDADSYRSGDAYEQSKLANLLFTYELDRRLAGSGIHALAAHPGIVGSSLWRTSSAMARVMVSKRLRALNFWFAQDSAAGALPTLRAATDPDAHGSDYFGPNGWFEATGAPVRVESTSLSHDETAQRRLWELSEGLTGVRYPLPVG